MGSVHCGMWDGSIASSWWPLRQHKMASYHCSSSHYRDDLMIILSVEWKSINLVRRCWYWNMALGCWASTRSKSFAHWQQHNKINYIIGLIRKSKDYVYGIWVYKALGIWKGYYRVKKLLVSYVKPWTEARNNKYMKYHSKLTYQLSFWICESKSGLSCRRQVVHPRPQTPQGESVA